MFCWSQCGPDPFWMETEEDGRGGEVYGKGGTGGREGGRNCSHYVK